MRLRFPALLLAALPLAAADYAAEVAQGRARFDAELREKDSPLSLVARRTMRRGANIVEAGELAPLRVPPARVEWDGKTAALIAKQKFTLQTTPESAGIVRYDEGPVSLALHWNGRTGELFLRIYDQDAPKRRPITPRAWYNPDPRYRIEAEFVAFPQPETYTVSRADGTKTDYPSPGRARFRIGGATVTLRAIALPDGRLFLPFKDKTAPHATYGAGRFLYAAAPKDGMIVLDFNLANNPNCMFTPYWSCVLPPKENHLPVAIPAGEKLWPGAQIQ